MTKLSDLETPCVLIDLERVEANLQRAQAHADKAGLLLRPHIKTHKLPLFAHRQVALGACGITVQKLGEAEVMADAGLMDIFLPYNIIGPTKLARLKVLNARVGLKVTADSPDTVAGYASAFGSGDKPLCVLIECDTGGHRCGVQSPAQALALARQISGSPGLAFGGLMTYPAAGGLKKAQDWLAEAKQRFEQAGLACPVISSGGTPDFYSTIGGVVTEHRPGTYIYNDRYQVAQGAAAWDDCALTVLTTVVSRPTPTRIVIDAGSKSLSSDLLGQTGFGIVADKPTLVVNSLSEEHGVILLQSPSEWPRIGERLRIIPNHACVVSNLFDDVHLMQGEERLARVEVSARGRVD